MAISAIPFRGKVAQGSKVPLGRHDDAMLVQVDAFLATALQVGWHVLIYESHLRGFAITAQKSSLRKNGGQGLAVRLVPRRVGRVIPLRSGQGQMAVAEFPAAGEWLAGQ